jgi:nitrate reductase NapE|tara:strand:+ start:3977 stop:4147 length:171 start_codon:yes stop_codon:yes gene_type:complete
MNDPTQVTAPEPEIKSELKAFLFVTVFLAPILSVVIVGGYGFVIWISQILAGPPAS